MATNERLSDTDAVNEIHHYLDGREWDAGDLEGIADVIRRTGRTIRSPFQSGGPRAGRTRLWDEDGVCLTCGDLRDRCTGDRDDYKEEDE